MLHHEGPLNTHTELDSPEISQSIGHDKGFVVLWPRIVPRTGDPVAHGFAERLQKRLGVLANAVDAGASIDTRPEPERVCPKTGCAGVALGVVVTVKGEACAAAALISRPGPSPVQIVPWVGKMELKRAQTPFREPPESDIRITEFAICKTVFETMDKTGAPGDEAALKAAIQAAHGS